MTAPRIYITINAKNVSFTRLTGDDIQFDVSDTEDSYSETSSDDTSSMTEESNSSDGSSVEPSGEEIEKQSDDDSEEEEDDDDDDEDTDTESDTTEETEDGHIDECPLSGYNDSQNAEDTCHIDFGDEYDTDHDSDLNTTPRPSEDVKKEPSVLLNVWFMHKNNIRMEQYLAPAASFSDDEYVDIPQRTDISRVPMTLYSVIRDSPLVESLLGIGKQYAILLNMLETDGKHRYGPGNQYEPNGRFIPFKYVEGSIAGKDITDVLSTVIYI